MKKRFVFIILATILVLVCAKIAMAALNTEENAEITNTADLVRDELIARHQQELNELIENIVTDAASSSDIDLAGYTRIELKEIMTNNEYSINHLAAIYAGITRTLQNYDYQPFLYISGDRGYIIVKRNNGINDVYVLLYREFWEIQDKRTTQGKVFTPLSIIE